MGTKKNFVIDTNVILHDYNCLKNFQENDIYLPLVVLEELDKFKKGNEQINFNAREFVRELDLLTSDELFSKGVSLGEGLGRLFIVPGNVDAPKVHESFPVKKPDHLILAAVEYLAGKYPKTPAILVTKDVNLRMKARSIGITSEDYITDKVSNVDIFEKSNEIFENVDPALIDRIYSSKEGIDLSEFDFKDVIHPNECFVLKSDRNSVLARYNPFTHSICRVTKGRNYGIEPRNAEQSFAFEILNDPNVKLVALTGKAGTGKTLLALAAALGKLTDYKQVLLARPVVALSNKDIGFLPGDAQEKVAPYMQPLFDNLNVIKRQFASNSTEVKRLEDMQKSNSLSGKDSQKISVIHQSAIRLLNLINQILEFRKTETQNKKLCVSRDNLAALVHEIGLKYKELNRKPEIDFCLEIEQEDMSSFFDKEVVTIILDNLISNAIKYTEKGTITLGLHQVVRNNIHHTEISVSDTGFGIAPDALPHIFDRYYQEGSEHQASGTGIGLALVKNLVVLHEGEIRVESSLNVGSTFYVSLLTDNTYPHVLHADSTEKTSDEKDEKEENTEPVHSGKRILLIVEDNRDICDYIVESFSDDFEVRTAANGEQGLEQALGCIPDIIVSDIMMPVMNGIVMCRKLKEDLRTSHIPIILLTAKDSLQDKEEGYQVGADSYLTKPFSATLLHSRIHNLLESRKLLAERFNTNSILIDKRAAVTESMNKLDNEFLEKINKLIEDRLSSEKIDIGYLSDAMCMSNSTLYRKMKALTGLSTNEYIRKIKMQYAERLLLEGKYNISEVAFKVGINSTVYFRQCFKDEFGMAPSDYLKKIKPE